MERIYKSLWICLALFCSNHALATIWRINNQSQSSEVFTSIQDAVDDDRVFAGDTLLIESSVQPYAGARINKRLVLLGTGYFLDENPETGIEGINSIVNGVITLISGSEGAVIQGLQFAKSTIASVTIEVDNIYLSHCYFSHQVNVNGSYRNGLIISKSYFEDDALGTSTITNVNHIIFNNNIVKGEINLYQYSTYQRTFSAIFNNLFLGSVDVSTSTYRNNIWLPLEQSSISVRAAVKEHNLNISVDMGTENNNQVISSLSDLYTGQGTSDSKWQMKDDSQYKNSGKDGTDPGPFGGSHPYVLSGLPPLPVIYELSTTGFGSEEGGLPVLIKVKSN